jgi:hypothetical protein
LPWKSLATFPPHVPSPTSSTELYSVRIKSQKVKTNRITGQPTGTGRAPLIEEPLLSKQAGPPLIGSNVTWTLAEEAADSGLSRINGRVRIEIEAERGGHVSWQKQVIEFDRAGYGLNYGKYYGGI